MGIDWVWSNGKKVKKKWVRNSYGGMDFYHEPTFSSLFLLLDYTQSIPARFNSLLVARMKAKNEIYNPWYSDIYCMC